MPQIVTNFNPYPAQTRILGGVLNGSEKHHVVCSGRQMGKSLLIINLVLKFALENNDTVSMVVSPVFVQAKKLYTDLIKAMGEGSVLIKSNNSQELIINFRNGSTVHFKSGESYDNLRGYTLDFLFVDEAAYQKADLWNEILKPMMLVRGKKVMFFSTPRGPNHFKDLFDMGENPEIQGWRSYRIKTEENPYIPKEEIETARKLLPLNVFLAEYEGVFTESSALVFDGFEDVCSLTTFPKDPAVHKEKTKKEHKYYAGLDLAIANDYTVLIVMDDEGNVVDWLRVNKTSWEQIIGEVADKINKWKAQTVVELNSIGSVVFERLRKLCGNKVISFTTTNKTKNDIIENLKLKISEQVIQLPTKDRFSDLHFELATFGYKILPSGALSYKGMSEHDDTVMSLAMCVKSWSDNRSKPKFMIGGR